MGDDITLFIKNQVNNNDYLKYKISVSKNTGVFKIDIDTYLDTGLKYLMERKYNEALLMLDKSIEINPKNLDTLLNSGICYLGLKQYDKALNRFNKALELDPSSEIGLDRRSYCYFKLNQADKAIDDIKKIMEINPKINWAYFPIASVYYLLKKDYTEAKKYYDKSIEYNPSGNMDISLI
jgi:tetratricopeptide (TPR) repeat protein